MQILGILKERVLQTMGASGLKLTSIPGLYMVRKNEKSMAQHAVTSPMAILCLQGQKQMRFGTGTVEISPGMLGVICVDSPGSSCLARASDREPFLAMHFLLDAAILADLLTEMPPDARPAMKKNSNIFIMDASLEFLEIFLQLAELLQKPAQIGIMAPMVLRQLHYLLLIGAPGGALRNLYMRGARDNRIIEAVACLKKELASPVSIETLARKVNMSVSNLHRQFKNFTGHSPLQYHKKLRLCEAQRLMLAENERADVAARAVGYESITQFNREYKRMFGNPPRRDISGRKKNLLAQDREDLDKREE